MKDLTEQIAEGFRPFKALLFYNNREDFYIESYEVDGNGMMVNAHPLTLVESHSLAESLGESPELKSGFSSAGQLHPDNLLHLDHGRECTVLWHTPAQRVGLFFRADLGIAEGQAFVPPLLWRANRTEVSLWALKTDKRPTLESTLYHAPFFNVYENGRVCLGTVKRNIPPKATITEFITLWERYFFDSSFSHTLFDTGIKGITMTDLWRRQVKGGKAFPTKHLVTTKQKLKSLL